MSAGDANVKTAFESLRGAAMILEAAEHSMGLSFREAAETLRRQEDMAWFTAPTMMKAPGVAADIERKIRLLHAAADFLSVHTAVRAEVLAEAGETAEATP